MTRAVRHEPFGDRAAIDALLAEFARTHDRQLRNRIVEQFTPLAEGVARRLSSRANREDLRQVALLGLLQAVERFDPGVGAPFNAFAVRTVEGECKRYLRDRTWAVRPPRRTQELHLDLRRVEEQLTQQLGRTPTVVELARASGADEEAVLEALEARGAHRGVSLDTPSEDRSEGAVASSLGSADERFGTIETRSEIDTILAQLSPQELSLIQGRFFQGRSQQELADELGISQSYLSRVLRRVLARLRDQLDEQEDGRTLPGPG
jgi:RNA polymerase sigma-B factor